MIIPVSDIIPFKVARTLAGLFRERVRRSPDAVAYRYFDESSKLWKDTTWAEMATWVARWQHALLREGLQPGERVAMLLRNCCEWVMFEQAALGLGLVVVPLYPNDRAAEGAPTPSPELTEPPMPILGEAWLKAYDTQHDDNFTQAGNLYRLMSDDQKNRIWERITAEGYPRRNG